MNVALEILSYADMETELHNAVNMSEVACKIMESAETPTARGVIITDSDWSLLTFAVFHSNELLLALKKRWNEVHDNNVAAKEGGAR